MQGRKPRTHRLSGRCPSHACQLLEPWPAHVLVLMVEKASRLSSRQRAARVEQRRAPTLRAASCLRRVQMLRAHHRTVPTRCRSHRPKRSRLTTANQMLQAQSSEVRPVVLRSASGNGHHKPRQVSDSLRIAPMPQVHRLRRTGISFENLRVRSSVGLASLIHEKVPRLKVGIQTILSVKPGPQQVLTTRIHYDAHHHQQKLRLRAAKLVLPHSRSRQHQLGRALSHRAQHSQP
mmetsp:Transcript_31240/g.75994  ORF Transcript_31240/g.75994 Transcript_31240/m.75994 type:complete len:234 (+) Transcript_31240:155-856(+)